MASGSGTAGSSRDDVEPLAGNARGDVGRDGRVLALDTIPLPGWHSVSNVAAAVAVGALFGLPADAPSRRASRASAAWSIGWSRSPRSTVSGSSTTPRAPSPMRSSPRSGASRRRWCSSAAVAPRVSPWTTWLPWSPSVSRLRCSSARAGRSWAPRSAPRAWSDTQQAEDHGRGGRDRGWHRPGRPCGARRARWRPPATVLLSPAAASFDMFPDYTARGRAFKAAVADARRVPPHRGGAPMTVNARPRSAARMPIVPSPASALLRDGHPEVGTTRRPPGRGVGATAPKASGDRRRQASPRSSMAVARPVDAVERAPADRPRDRRRPRRQGARPGAPSRRPVDHHRDRRRSPRWAS